MTHPSLPAGQSVEVPTALAGYYQSKGWYIVPGSSVVGPVVQIPGPSAYDVAVSNGFVGTEAEWLASLRGPVSTVPGPSGPGFVQPSQDERIPALHVIPSAINSSYAWTCPAGRVAQLTVTGGAGVSISINAGVGMATFLGGTGSSVIVTSGEVVQVAWGATVPTAVRTRVLLSLVSA